MAENPRKPDPKISGQTAFRYPGNGIGEGPRRVPHRRGCFGRASHESSVLIYSVVHVACLQELKSNPEGPWFDFGISKSANVLVILETEGLPADAANHESIDKVMTLMDAIKLLEECGDQQ